MLSDQVLVYDATLRESMQASGVRMNCDDMSHIAESLDLFGVDYIEAGWPGASRLWDEFFERIASGTGPRLEHAKLVAFGRTISVSGSSKGDVLFERLLSAPTDIVTIFGKTWPVHVTTALRTTLDYNLRMIEESVRLLVHAGKTVIFDAEHFFQSVLTGNREYAVEALSAAEGAGANQLILCDTNGVAGYWDVEEAVGSVVGGFPKAIIGVHVHGDRGMSTANSIAAVRAGAKHVQGTLNGYSERVQMACTIEVLSNLHLLIRENRIKGASIHPRYRPELSRHLSRRMDRACGLSPYERKPFVGECDGLHKAGVHGSAVLRDTHEDGLYQSHDPVTFGGELKIVLSSVAGKANVVAVTKVHWDVPFAEDDERIPGILKRVEELEEQGYRLDVCDASAAILIAEALWPSASVGWKELADEPLLNKVSKNRVVATMMFCDDALDCSYGDGPVDAMVNVAKSHYAKSCPSLSDLSLYRFDSTNLDRHGLHGSASAVRVEIEWSHPEFGLFKTQGVTTSQDSSAWCAIEEAVKFIFYKWWRSQHPYSENPGPEDSFL